MVLAGTENGTVQNFRFIFQLSGIMKFSKFFTFFRCVNGRNFELFIVSF